MGFPGGSDGKESACSVRDRFDPWVGKIWRREWLPTPVILPGESHEQRSLVGYSPWGRKELYMIERLSLTGYSPKSRKVSDAIEQLTLNTTTH